MRILVIEDDAHMADALRRGLSGQHYSVDVTGDGREGEEMAKINDYDLIILDLMLPKKDGRAICVDLRQEGVATPIMMLTALDDVDARITGLDVGADDYVTKPFHFGELLARVRSLVRRRTEHRTAELQVADLVLDTTN